MDRSSASFSTNRIRFGLSDTSLLHWQQRALLARPAWTDSRAWSMPWIAFCTCSETNDYGTTVSEQAGGTVAPAPPRAFRRAAGIRSNPGRSVRCGDGVLQGPLDLVLEDGSRALAPAAGPEADQALTVHDHEAGKAVDLKGTPDRLVAVAAVQPRQLVLRKVAAPGLLAVVAADAEDDQAFGSELLGQALDRRSRLLAWPAPGGPEVHQHDLAFELLQGQRLPLQRSEGDRGSEVLPRPQRVLDQAARLVRQRAGGDSGKAFLEHGSPLLVPAPPEEDDAEVEARVEIVIGLQGGAELRLGPRQLLALGREDHTLLVVQPGEERLVVAGERQDAFAGLERALGLAPALLGLGDGEQAFHATAVGCRVRLLQGFQGRLAGSAFQQVQTRLQVFVRRRSVRAYGRRGARSEQQHQQCAGGPPLPQGAPPSSRFSASWIFRSRYAFNSVLDACASACCHCSNASFQAPRSLSTSPRWSRISGWLLRSAALRSHSSASRKRLSRNKTQP